MDDDHPELPGTVHLHRLALSCDLERLRLQLTLLVVCMDNSWTDILSERLAMEALLTAAVACGVEVTAGDVW